MKRNSMDYIITVLGILLLGTGLFLIKSITNPQGFLKALPYICVGLGCGTFGHGMGSILNYMTLKNNPDLQKRQEIEKNDERNISIGNSAKAKAYDMMVFVFGALMISFALMNIDIVAILLLVFAYILVISYGLYYRIKYDKEM